MFTKRRVALLSSVLGGGCLFVDPGPASFESGEGGAEGTAPTTGAAATTDGPGPGSTTGEAPIECAWEQVLGDPHPPARIDAGLALASGRDRVLLFGGRAGFVGPDLDDTWTFDGKDWRRLYGGDGGDDGDDDEEEATGPSPRRGHAMAYDPARDRVVLFGGEFGGIDVKFAADTFTHDGDAWTRRGGGPPLRAFATMAWLAGEEVVVLFGGRTDKGPDAGTWVWDGQDWTERKPMVRPPARYGHTMAVGDDGTVLVHGGCGDMLCGMVLDDTWGFDGKEWKKLGMAPGGVRWGGMARQGEWMRTLRFGEGESWRWVGDAWMAAGAAPQALGHFSIAELPGVGLALFGGLTAKVIESEQTWLLRCDP